MLATVIVVYISCKKNQTAEPSAIANQLFAKNAKQFFLDSVASQVTHTQNNSDPIASFKKTPLWDNAYVKQVGENSVLLVPVYFDSPLFAKSNTGKGEKTSINELANLVIYKDNHQVFHAELLFSIPDSNYAASGKKLFTGEVFVHDWSMTSIKGFKYNSQGLVGVHTGFQTIDKSKLTDAIAHPNTSPQYFDNCTITDWYSCTDVCSYLFSRMTCDQISGIGGDVYTINYQYMLPGGGTSSSPPTAEPGVNTITNKIKDPCILSVFNLIGGPNMTNAINAFLVDFKSTKKYSYTFTDLYAGGTPSTTTIIKDPTTGVVTGFEIKINKSLTKGYSQEAFTELFDHEICHAFVLSGDLTLTTNQQHDLILTQLLSDLIHANQQVNPGLSQRDAAAMALEGLAKLQIFDDTSDDWNQALSTYNLTMAQIDQIWTAYTTGPNNQAASGNQPPCGLN